MAASVQNICNIDVSYLQKRFTAMQEKQLPFAVSKSLNDTANLAMAGVKSAMASAFDKPTPYTLNSLYVERATKSKLFAVLQFKDQGRGTPASRYLLPEVFGGIRAPKPFESIERRLGALPAGMLMVPGRGVSLNSYGNVPLAKLETILATATGATFAKSRRGSQKGRSKPLSVFVGSPAGGRLPMGIWQRMSDGTIRPLFVFVTRASYKARLPIGAIAGDIYAANFPALFDKAFADAQRTATP